MCVAYLKASFGSGKYGITVSEGYLDMFFAPNESFWMVPGTYEE